MKHTKLLSIVEDILSEGKTLWKAPRGQKYENEAHAKREMKKMPSKLQKYFTTKSVDGPSYGVDVEVNKSFEKKAETLDQSMDTYTKEIDGFEITLADGYYPISIAKFDESEWK
jgi:hypothetical protein